MLTDIMAMKISEVWKQELSGAGKFLNYGFYAIGIFCIAVFILMIVKKLRKNSLSADFYYLCVTLLVFIPVFFFFGKVNGVYVEETKTVTVTLKNPEGEIISYPEANVTFFTDEGKVKADVISLNPAPDTDEYIVAFTEKDLRIPYATKLKAALLPYGLLAVLEAAVLSVVIFVYKNDRKKDGEVKKTVKAEEEEK